VRVKKLGHNQIQVQREVIQFENTQKLDDEKIHDDMLEDRMVV